MSQTTKIQWCDSTVNPVMGCSGCELWNADRKTCYAGQLHQLRKTHKGFSPDFDTPKLFAGRMVKAAGWPDLTGTNRTDKPWLDGLPRLVFVSDMGDALSEQNVIDSENRPVGGGVPFDFLKAEIIDNVISTAGQRHQWLWLTKRPNRQAAFAKWLKKEREIEWPDNLWAGTTVTGKKTLNRINQLSEVGGTSTIRFISVEPLWEEISLAGRLKGISWVIVGGESRQGSDAKEFKLEWARQLGAECRHDGVAFFLKQIGSRATLGGNGLNIGTSHGDDWSRWPKDLRVREMPVVQK